MIEELLHKYNISSKYTYEFTNYLYKFIDDPYLMDINADVLSRLDLENIILIFDEFPGAIEVTYAHRPDNKRIWPNKVLGQLNLVSDDDISVSEYQKEILILELLNNIKDMLPKSNNILGINKLVAKIGIIIDLSTMRSEVKPFTEADTDEYRILIRSEITNNRSVIRDYKIKLLTK
jgi:hypothetical protein